MNEFNINIAGYNADGICVGCLNFNRKMFDAGDVKECLKLLCRIDVPQGRRIQVCWECLAAVQTVCRFRAQVTKSFAVLKEYSKKHRYLESMQALTKHASTRLSSQMVSITSTQWSAESSKEMEKAGSDDDALTPDDDNARSRTEEVKMELEDLYADPLSGFDSDIETAEPANVPSDSEDEVIQLGRALRSGGDNKRALLQFKDNSVEAKPIKPTQIDVCTPPPDKVSEQLAPYEQPIAQQPALSPLKARKCMELENLLKQSLETAFLLNYTNCTIDGDSARNVLAAIIAKEIINENQTTPIRCEIYFKWANAIKTLFPGERTTTYYVPASTTASGACQQARGKLVCQVMNQRRRLQKLGALVPKRKRSSANSTSSSPSLNRLAPELPKQTEYPENEYQVARNLEWLRNSSQPWDLVEKKWRDTIEKRLKNLQKEEKQPGHTVEAYFQEYPALKEPLGYVLLKIDFEAAYGKWSNNLYVHYPLVKWKILDLIQKKKNKHPLCQEIIDLTKDRGEDQTNLAAFLSLPHLLNTSSTTQKKKRKVSSRNWKPSKIEARDSFIKHVRADAEIVPAIKKRLATLREKGPTSQPFVMIVGENLTEIKSYFVVTNESVIYERPNIVDAIDTCFKLFWALNLDYGYESYSIWYFIQKCFYKMASKHDKGSTSVESLMTDCGIV